MTPADDQFDPFANAEKVLGRSLSAPTPTATPPGTAPPTTTPSGTTPPTAAPPGTDQAFDPFAAAEPQLGRSLTAPSPPTQTAVSAPTSPAAEIRQEPWYQDLGHKIIGHAMNAATGLASPGAAREYGHSLSLGLDDLLIPLPEALYAHLTKGVPFGQAYVDAQNDREAVRANWEAQNPDAAWAAWGAGLISPSVAGSLAKMGIKAAGVPVLRGTLAALKRVDDLYTGMGPVGLGAVAGFGMTEGDLSQRLEGAGTGAIGGAVLGKALPAATRAVSAGVRGLAGAFASPEARAAPIARGLLEEAEPRLADPTASRIVSPEIRTGTDPTTGLPTSVPVRMGIAGATDVLHTDPVTGAQTWGGSPALAAAQRLGDKTDDARAIELLTGQSADIRAGLGAGLRIPIQSVTSASENIAQAMRDGWGILRQYASNLYKVPELLNRGMDAGGVITAVQKEVSGLPQSLQLAYRNEPALANAVNDLDGVTTLDGINAVRSNVLDLARSYATADQRPQARVANNIAAAMGKEMRSQLASDPDALQAYDTAQATFRKVTKLFAEPQLRKLVQAGAGEADTRAAAGTLFDVSGSSVGERFKGRVGAINDMLNTVKKASATVGQSGLAANPVQAVQDRLSEGYRSGIINSILDAAIDKSKTGPAGEALYRMNTLRRVLNENIASGWLQKSGMINANGMRTLNDTMDAATRAGRLDALRGTTNSTTFESWVKDGEQKAKMLDYVQAPIIRHTRNLMSYGKRVALGGLLSHILGPALGDPLAEMLGFSVMGFGHPAATEISEKALARITAARKLLHEALYYPAGSAALQSPATAAAFNKMPPASQEWLRHSLRRMLIAGGGAAMGAAASSPTGAGNAPTGG